MTNFGLVDSFLGFIKSQNNFKEAITRFKKYVYFPRYTGVRTLQVRDKYFTNPFIPDSCCTRFTRKLKGSLREFPFALSQFLRCWSLCLVTCWSLVYYE